MLFRSVGIGAGGGKALEFADLGANFGGQCYGQAGPGISQEFRGPAFVVRVRVGMQVADGDRFYFVPKVVLPAPKSPCR